MSVRMSPTSRYRNIDAEQARLGMSDADVASYLKINRVTYQRKKRKVAPFYEDEIRRLVKLTGKTFEELFEVE